MRGGERLRAPGLRFRTKGQLPIDISTDAATDGIRPDFYCGDEVYSNCTELRGHFESKGQAYVLRVPSNSPSPCKPRSHRQAGEFEHPRQTRRSAPRRGR